jgi:predicted nucleic acid-binding protein
VTDDATARVVATLLWLAVYGSLGVVLWATARAHINRPEADAILRRSRQ